MVVYKTTNLINGKIYVGKDETNNPNYLGSGYKLKLAIIKNGRENFVKEILEICNDRQHLQEREIFWISKLNATNDKIGYNIANGGNGGNTYCNLSDERLNGIKSKISKSMKNRVFSDEHKKRLSEAAKRRKGNKPSKFKGMKYEDYMDPQKAAELRKKSSENAKRPMSEETKKKISDSTKGRVLGPMSDTHIENLKRAFIERDKKRTKIARERNINILDEFLLSEVTEDNANYARRIYQKVKCYDIDMTKYNKLLLRFKEIEFSRRSNRKSS